MPNAMNVSLHGVEFALEIPADNARATRFRETFEERGDYEVVMAAVLKRLLERDPTPVFADIGSFIGYYTCYAGRIVNDRAPVFAIESNGAYARTTERSARLNGLDRVEVVHYALADTPGQAGTDGPKLVSAAAGEATPATTLDDLFADHDRPPEVLKIDVHGAEGLVLKGGRRMLRDCVSHVLLELHPNVYLQRYSPGTSREQILDLLAECGFSTWYVAGHRYSWSDGLHEFLASGRFAYMPLDDKTRPFLLFDRTNHIFVYACKEDPAQVLGEPVTDPSIDEYPDWVTT